VIEFHLFAASDSQGFVRFVDWAAFRKWVIEQGTVIIEAPDAPGKPMILRTVG